MIPSLIDRKSFIVRKENQEPSITIYTFGWIEIASKTF